MRSRGVWKTEEPFLETELHELEHDPPGTVRSVRFDGYAIAMTKTEAGTWVTHTRGGIRSEQLAGRQTARRTRRGHS